MITTETTTLAAWIRRSAIAGHTLEPAAPLDDLEPFRDLVAGARVVALGESAHYVPEFHLLRHRLLRFLVEHCGFSTYALEAPFTTAGAIDDWVQGAAGDIRSIADAAMPIHLGRVPELHATLTWMRERASDGQSLGFAGVDVPGSGGSITPALVHVRDVLRSADPDALPLVERAIELAATDDDVTGTFGVLGRYAALAAAQQDELSALLGRLLSRMETMRAHHDRHGRGPAAAAARHEVRGAWHADHLHRDFAGRGLAVAPASRDAFMAESVLKVLEDGGSDTRVVLGAHNVHIQRLPGASGGPVGMFPLGYHLAQALGDDYLAIGFTSTEGRTAQIQPAPATSDGFEIVDMALPRLPEDGIEAAFPAHVPVAIADLRGARSKVDDAGAYRHIRMEGYFVDLPVVDAFDAIAHVPRTTVSDDMEMVIGSEG